MGPCAAKRQKVHLHQPTVSYRYSILFASRSVSLVCRSAFSGGLQAKAGDKMGYAGYAPGKYAPPPPTAVQAALYAVEDQAALELIAKLTKNVVVSPTGVQQAAEPGYGMLF